MSQKPKIKAVKAWAVIEKGKIVGFDSSKRSCRRIYPFDESKAFPEEKLIPVLITPFPTKKVIKEKRV